MSEFSGLIQFYLVFALLSNILARDHPFRTCARFSKNLIFPCSYFNFCLDFLGKNVNEEVITYSKKIENATVRPEIGK